MTRHSDRAAGVTSNNEDRSRFFGHGGAPERHVGSDGTASITNDTGVDLVLIVPGVPCCSYLFLENEHDRFYRNHMDPARGA